MAGKSISISGGLGWLKTLRARHAELVTLRNSSAASVAVGYQGNTTTTVPVYDVKKLDKRITLLAREIRLCDTAIKEANAGVELKGYLVDDGVLGELE